jgi:P-aminobenzoate N-oxygenase AurF
MFTQVLYDPQALALQVARQKKYAWDLDQSISWKTGVDPLRYLLPVDSDAIAFPGASAEQKLAISQLLGLIVNSTIAEMEDVITKLRFHCWNKILRSYPVSPELWELGELFFDEEKKHSLAFHKYNVTFCSQIGIDISDLNLILPKAYGSLFLKAITQNAKWGGHAFWWVVAAVEEVSIDLYRHLGPFKKEIDPLYHEIHLRHMEEESRHHNYAFLMLEVLREKNHSLSDLFFSKTDRVIGQIFSTGWVVAELNKVFEVKKIRHKHPFFDALASSLPLFEKIGTRELAQKLFISAPYISLMLNGNHHAKTSKIAKEHQVLSLPFPTPKTVPTEVKLKIVGGRHGG